MSHGRRFNDTRNPVQLLILDRVGRGEVLTRLCREPEMPGMPTVRRWRRRSDWFDAALAEARRVGRERRLTRFDEARAAEVLARLRAGESVRAITGRRGATVGPRLLRYWMGVEAPFCAEVVRLTEENRRRRLEARPGPWPFDQAAADRLVAAVARGRTLGSLVGPASGAGFPGVNVIYRWRREQPDFDQGLRIAIRIAMRARRRRATAEAVVAPERLGPIMTLLASGRSLKQISKRPDMPSAFTFHHWKRRYPDFAQAVAEAQYDRGDLYLERMDELAGQTPTPASRREFRLLKARLKRLEARHA